MTINYPLTIKALQRVDEFAAQTEALLDKAETETEVAFWNHVLLMRNDYVRQAFLVDTADRNTWSQLRCMSVEDIREIVRIRL